MKAIVYRKNGPPEVLTCEEIEKPAPKENEVLIKVHAAAVNPLDVHVLKGGPLIFRLLFGRGKSSNPESMWPGPSKLSAPQSRSSRWAMQCSETAMARMPSTQWHRTQR